MASEQQNGDTMKNDQKEKIEPEMTGDKAENDNPKESTDEKDGKVNKEEDEEEESSDEEELPLGSVEAPVQIMTGKRDRKKVERLVVADTPKTPEKKFEVPVGKGTKLGDIGMINYYLHKFKAQDLKPLHKFLYGKTVRDLRVTRKNIKLFTGFNFEKDDAEYVKRETMLCKFTVEGMKELCTILDVEKKGTKDKMMDRLMEFCLYPKRSDRQPPEKAGKKTDKTKTPNKKSKPKKSKGSAKKTKAGGDASTVSEDGDTTMDDGTEGEKEGNTSVLEGDSKPKKTKSKSTPKPKKKKDKKEKKHKKHKDKKDTPKSKAKSPKKKTAVKSPSKQSKEASPVKSPKKIPQKRKLDNIDNNSSDDEPLLKKTKSPPTDKEIKVTIQDILEGANLEEVTMKMVCRRVYDTYPEFPLQHKKDFIKTTVREIIS